MIARAGFGLALLIAGAGCRVGTAGVGNLDTPAARRLVGVWTLQLVRRPERFAPAGARPDTLDGPVAIIPNRSDPGASWNAHPMTAAGAFDLALDRWGHPGGAHELMGRTYGDSVEILLDPRAGSAATWLAGVWRGDRVTGEWVSDRGRGASDAGAFTLVPQR